MKFSKIAFATAVFSALATQSLWAQGLRQPSDVRAVNYDYYADGAAPAAPSPSDKKPAAAPAAPAAPAAAAPAPMAEPAAEEKKEEEKKEEECKPWELFGTTCSGWHVYGLMEAGVTGNNFGKAVDFNGPVGFNDRNEGMLNQLDLIIEKKVEAGECCWNWGGRMEWMFGRDSLFIQSTGLELHDDNTRHWNDHRFYGVALTQAYIEGAKGDNDVKFGKMVTALEYEVIAPNGNFFYSHSYGFLYAVPFTHTGVMASHKRDENWTLVGGLFNGWDHFDREPEDRIAVHGGFIYTPCHKEYTITFNMINGDETDATGNFANRTAASLVFDWKKNECDEVVVVADLGIQDRGVLDTAAPGGARQAEWFGINSYFFRKLNDCWRVGARADWFRDDDGVRVAGAGATAGSNPYQGGSVGDFYEITLGANYTPHVNLTVRPEIRYDWFDGSGTRPFDNNSKVAQWTSAFDVIFTY